MSEMNYDIDTQYEVHVIKRADSEMCGERAGWTLNLEDGFCIWCTGESCATQPQPGETARLYGKGFGYDVRGIVIEGRVYRYLTEEQAKDRHAQEVRAEQLKRQAALAADRASRDERRAALPEPFRRRLDGFEAARADWRRDNEPYELFCCEEAARLAARFKTADELVAFAKLPHDEQKAAAPDLRLDEHSGNTFGASLGLARLCLEQPELVPLQHGAICPLLGCVETGCHAARVEPRD